MSKEKSEKIRLVEEFVEVSENGDGEVTFEITEKGLGFCDFYNITPERFIKEIVVESLMSLGIKKEEAEKIKVNTLETPPKKKKKPAVKTNRRKRV